MHYNVFEIHITLVEYTQMRFGLAMLRLNHSQVHETI